MRAKQKWQDTTFESMISVNEGSIFPQSGIGPHVPHVTHHTVLSEGEGKRNTYNHSLEQNSERQHSHSAGKTIFHLDLKLRTIEQSISCF